VGADTFGQGEEGGRRDSQIVDPLRRRAAGGAELLLGLVDHIEQGAGVAGVEASAGEAQPPPELVPRTFAGLGPEFLEALAGPGREVLVCQVAPPVTDEPPVLGQEALLRQTVKSW
jgi:hypothetical protein